MKTMTALEISKRLPMTVRTPRKLFGLIKGKEVIFQEVKIAADFFKLIGVRDQRENSHIECVTYDPSEKFEVIDEANN